MQMQMQLGCSPAKTTTASSPAGKQLAGDSLAGIGGGVRQFGAWPECRLANF